MADITPQISDAFRDGLCSRVTLFTVKNATAGDTFDVGGQFRVVKRAAMVSETGSNAAAVQASGTVLTVPNGPNQDGIWVLVIGVAV